MVHKRDRPYTPIQTRTDMDEDFVAFPSSPPDFQWCYEDPVDDSDSGSNTSDGRM